MGWKRTDDLNGAEAEQITFGLDGQAYMIDLGADNLARLRKALQPFLTVAQVYADLPQPPALSPAEMLAALDLTEEQMQPEPEPVKPAAPTPAPRAPRTLRSVGGTSRRKGKTADVPVATIRAWAQRNGFEGVGPKGRIPDAIVAQYHEAGGQDREV